jgi:hypothetical protein
MEGIPRFGGRYENIWEKFSDLIRNGVIEECPYENLIWVNPSHLVPKANGDKRLVMDATKVNRWMRKIHFKMEGVPTLKETIQKNDYAISFDLKEAYNHVPVHSTMQPLLGICWNGKAYKYVGMPFGLSDAPRVFSQIIKKVVNTIRDLWRIKAVIYLDDLILLHQNPDHLKKVGQEVTEFLEWLGWTVNLEKSQLDPSQTFKYLGWQWNSSELTVQIPKERREKALALLREFRKKCFKTKMVDVRWLAKVIGVLSAMRTQWPSASLYLLKMNQLKSETVNQKGWNTKCRLNPSLIGELRCWTNMVKNNKPQKIQQFLTPQVLITTDASPFGWGASLKEITSSSNTLQKLITSTTNLPIEWDKSWNKTLRSCLSEKSERIVSGGWPKRISENTSNYRELMAIYYAIMHWLNVIKQRKWRSLLIMTDNTTAMYNINRRAAAPNLAPTLRKLLNLIDRNDLRIRATHIPGSANKTTDALSRLERSGDYSLKKGILEKICPVIGIYPDVDLFASKRNHLLQTYCSLRYQPAHKVNPPPGLIRTRKKGDAGNPLGNAFHLNWKGLTPLIHPPIPLIYRALEKFSNEGDMSILIAPDWPGQTWNSLLHKLHVKKIVLGDSEEVLEKGPGMKRRNMKLPPGKIALFLLKTMQSGRRNADSNRCV